MRISSLLLAPIIFVLFREFSEMNLAGTEFKYTIVAIGNYIKFKDFCCSVHKSALKYWRKKTFKIYFNKWIKNKQVCKCRASKKVWLTSILARNVNNSRAILLKRISDYLYLFFYYATFHREIIFVFRSTISKGPQLSFIVLFWWVTVLP